MTRPLRVTDGLPVHPYTPLDMRDYRLRIDGLVSHPLALDAAELAAFPEYGFNDDFVCLEGWVAPDLHWRGLRLSDLLDQAEVHADAQWVQASSGDFSLPLPLRDARTALLALKLDGAPLEAAHGAPVRLVVPGGECFTSVKWVDHLELRATPAGNTAEAIARARLATR